jgi:hypothetical protein
MENIYMEIWNYLRSEGIDAPTAAKAVDLTRQYLHNVERYQKDALLLDAPKANPWVAILDEALGEPLRKLKALGAEIRRDIGIVAGTGFLASMAAVHAGIDRAKATLDGQQAQIDRLQSEVRSQQSGGAEPGSIGPPPVYEQMEAAKQERRQRFRALW